MGFTTKNTKGTKREIRIENRELRNSFFVPGFWCIMGSEDGRLK